MPIPQALVGVSTGVFLVSALIEGAITVAVLEAIEAEGAFIRGTSQVGDELQAEADLFLAHLPERFDGLEGDLVDPAETLALMRIFGMYGPSQ